MRNKKKKQTAAITIVDDVVTTFIATAAASVLPFLSSQPNCKASCHCFPLHILMDSIPTVISHFRGSLTLSFQLFAAIMLNMPSYFLFSIFLPTLFCVSLETLTNRFVVRVWHQKYFREIKRSYRHFFFLSLSSWSYHARIHQIREDAEQK